MSKAIRWRKVGGGSFRMGDTVVNSGEVLVAAKEEIPPAFRMSFVPLEEIPVEEEERILSPVYVVVPSERRPGGGWFEVLEKTSGKIMNENPLRKKKAEALVEELI